MNEKWEALLKAAKAITERDDMPDWQIAETRELRMAVKSLEWEDATGDGNSEPRYYVTGEVNTSNLADARIKAKRLCKNDKGEEYFVFHVIESIKCLDDPYVTTRY